MTSNDVPTPGIPPGRRRTLGRGPGASASRVQPLPAPVEPVVLEATGVRAAEADTADAADTTGWEEDTGVEPPAAPAPALPPTHEPPPPDEPSAPEPDPAHEPPQAETPGEEPRAVAEAATVAVPETASVPGPVSPAEPHPPTLPEPGSGTRQPLPADTRPRGEAEDAPDGVFKVRLANFEGPFDLLLQLISKHKLDVTEVALSKVTDEFMGHIRAMGPDWDLDQTTEFLVVAATLLDLKAARLLPAAEVEDEADLALLEARDLLFARLLQYRAYKQIADIFQHRLERESRRYPRTVGLEPHHAELLPEVVISIGAEGFAKLAVKAMQPKPKPQVYVDHIHAPLVSVQEQAGIVVARLRELGEASFRALVEDTDDTLTVVARFLALLELYREKAVALEQETALGDLLVRWTGGDSDEAPKVTDEFDRPPEEPKEEKKA
ncbi:segregation and condensation protein A [Streptomyces brasiliensis]|uniref:Segregation and condensation protein A n=1 Tax=Streptomyces brasiliensis TaxID=1954 RepID=A0A917K6K5_9ACTN|nr:segregation/condensation protein A [Streptomyces brasiliensis]GGJ02890.1 hypothetical protein GCM10010121_011580 [Streptomyces brasiliensis]